MSRHIIKGNVCNFSMPIPVNPISIISSVGDISKDIKLNNTYEWLFFYIDNIFGR